MTILSSRISSVTYLSENFALLRMKGDAFKGRDWTPGDKIQIGVAPGRVGRTYTPLSWDGSRGLVELLVFMHGDAPGCQWARNVKPGDGIEFVGPRPSLDLAAVEAPVVLFGDETCFGLAAALHHGPAGLTAHYLFEVGDVAEARSVLRSLGLERVYLCERLADGSHLAAVEAELARVGAGAGSLILAGKASSIQHVQRANRASDARVTHVKTKAYWAEGKTGLS